MVDFAIPALVFGSVIMLVLAIRAMLGPRAIGRRLAHLGPKQRPTEFAGRSLMHGQEKGWSGLLARIGRGREGADASRLRSRLVRAGYRRPSAPMIFYGVRPTLAIGGPAIVALLPGFWALPSVVQLGMLIVLSAIFYVFPSIALDSRIKSRQRELVRALPDALDLMVVCVEAGFGINQSLAQVSDEFASKCPIIAKEFSLVVEETRAGKSTTEALRALADRTGVSDISSLVALLVQTERFGTSLANALRVHADSMRVVRMQRAEERAQKATLKLILPSTMIFTALLVIFIAPGAYMMLSALSSR